MTPTRLNDALERGRAALPPIEADLAAAWAGVLRYAAQTAIDNLRRHGAHALERRLAADIEPLLARRRAGEVSQELDAEIVRQHFAGHDALATDPSWHPPDADEVLHLPGLEAKAAKKTSHLRVAALEAVAEPIADEFGISFDLANPIVSSALAQLGQQITRISQDTRQRIMSELQDAYDQGASIDDAAAAVAQHVGGQAAVDRGAMIARTEIVGASNAGSLAMAQLTGAASHKVWLATMDDRTRDTHAEADGQEVPLADAFSVGGAAMQFPGDPDGPVEEVANCRCTVTYSDGSEGLMAAGARSGPKTTSLQPDGSLKVVVAAAPAPAPADGQTEEVETGSWSAVSAPLDTPTIDGRMLSAAGAAWRELPLTLMGMRTTPHGFGANECVPIGQIQAFEVKGKQLRSSGVFDSGQDGQEFRRMIGEGTIDGNSVDVAVKAYELLVTKDGEIVKDAGPEESEKAWWGEDGYDILVNATEYTVLGQTVCPFPAFDDAKITLTAAAVDGEQVLVETNDEKTLWRVWSRVRLERPLTAAAAGFAPAAPPVAWFDQAEPAYPEPLTVEDDGRIHGHLAAWGSCHIGYPDGCVDPPRSPSGYAYFHTGELVTAEGDRVAVGRVTLGTSHADLSYSRQAAAEHYDHTGTVVAYVVARDGEHGPWLSGALCPELDASRVREFRASAPSGDWRPVNGALELVGVLGVNVQGFPMPRSRVAVVAGGKRVVTALVAAGGPGSIRAARPTAVRALAVKAAGVGRVRQRLAARAAGR